MLRKLHPTAGSRPGTLIIPDNALATRVHVVHYNREEVVQTSVTDTASLADAMSSDRLVWIHVQGLRDVELLLQIAEHFGIHPLALEDVVNVPQRPKQEVTDRYLLAVMRAVPATTKQGVAGEQVTLILGERFVLSFQESYEPRFQPVLDRLQRPEARLRKYGPDYLAYVLLDTVVDGYFPILDRWGEELDRLESLVLAAPHPSQLQRITQIKKDLSELRRTTAAQREMVSELLRASSSLATEEIKTFTRDTYDHCIQIAEVVDMFRESATGLVNTYLSSLGQRTNDVMKTLTIVGSIFIPLTFLAGIYGMNFEHMPELQSRWAYPMIWLLMAGIAIGMVGYFYCCGWIGDRVPAERVGKTTRQADPNVSAVQTADWDQSAGPARPTNQPA